MEKGIIIIKQTLAIFEDTESDYGGGGEKHSSNGEKGSKIIN
ncbi:MAG TPA: hypothetical protein VII93_05855 [Anaerolineales bacterium]